MSDNWTIYVTTPAGKMVEWDDWKGDLIELLDISYEKQWVYLHHNTITMEVFFKAND